MITPETCIGRAEEAERLAALVSYERDRVRLARQAAEWRLRADELRRSAPPEPTPPPPGLWARLSRIWRRRGG